MTKSETAGVKHVGAMKYSLGQYESLVQAKLNEYQTAGSIQKLWNKDASLWTGKDESQWLGWLTIVQEQLTHFDTFKRAADDAKTAGFKQALLIGMGGSSLCVEVLRMTLGTTTGYPDMHVLDSTVPEQVERLRSQLDLAKTLMIVASKSGSTTEPNVLCQYFYEETKKVVGDKVGQHFIAITDPGSSMEKTASELQFRAVYHGVPAIGGRFSAISNFGMIPAAVSGLDVKSFLEHASRMVEACSGSIPAQENPGALLGTILGVLAKHGRDKITVICSSGISSLGAWLEQLMAESTGKEGTGLIPIAGEELIAPDGYGKDRLFVYVRLANGADPNQDKAVKALEDAGHPVVHIEMADKIELGAEFFRWEFATAVAGAILGINAFNQPNVQESKDYTKKFLADYSQSGKLPEDILLFEDEGIKLYVDASNKERLEKAVGSNKSLDTFIKAHIDSIKDGDYFATNTYIDRNDSNERAVDKIRSVVLHGKHVATTVGFGPRFLHSTGQLHKGGPNTGVFLQITSEDKKDLAIPGEKFTFGILKQAQALGDFLALSNRHRRLLRIHLPADVQKGLTRIQESVSKAVK